MISLLKPFLQMLLENSPGTRNGDLLPGNVTIDRKPGGQFLVQKDFVEMGDELSRSKINA